MEPNYMAIIVTVVLLEAITLAWTYNRFNMAYGDEQLVGLQIAAVIFLCPFVLLWLIGTSLYAGLRRWHKLWKLKKILNKITKNSYNKGLRRERISEKKREATKHH